MDLCLLRQVVAEAETWSAPALVLVRSVSFREGPLPASVTPPALAPGPVATAYLKRPGLCLQLLPLSLPANP